MDLTEIKCQEITRQLNDMPIPCGRTSERSKVVFYQNDGRNVYVMCDQCADHAIKNRGAIELTPATAPQRFSDSCEQCAGTGFLLMPGPVASASACPDCGGSGKDKQRVSEASPFDGSRATEKGSPPPSGYLQHGHELPHGIGCRGCREAGECNECGRPGIAEPHDHCVNGRCNDCCATVCKHRES